MPTSLSSGIVVVRKDTSDRWLFLLLRVFSYWDFPKGMVQTGEDPWAAARRELFEETGINSIKETWPGQFYETEIYSRGKKARYYMAEALNDQVELKVSPEIGRPEHHEYRWMSFGDALKVLGPRVGKALVWAEDLLLKTPKSSL